MGRAVRRYRARWGETRREVGEGRSGFRGHSGVVLEEERRGPFIMGEEVSWADFVMGAHLLWFNKAWGDDNPLWNAVIEGNGGVWKKLFDALKEYETIN